MLAQQFLLNHQISLNLGNASFTNEVINSVNITNSVDCHPLVILANTVENIIKSIKNERTLLLNSCFNTGYFPKDWKQSKTMPILKPGKNNS